MSVNVVTVLIISRKILLEPFNLFTNNRYNNVIYCLQVVSECAFPLVSFNCLLLGVIIYVFIHTLQVYLIASCVCLYYCRGKLQQAFLAAQQQQVWAVGGLNNHRFVHARPNEISAVSVIQLWCFGPLQGAWVTESSDMEGICRMSSFYSDLLQLRTSAAELRGGSLFGFCSAALVKRKVVHCRQVLVLCAGTCKRNVPRLKGELRASSPQGYLPPDIVLHNQWL